MLHALIQSINDGSLPIQKSCTCEEGGAQLWIYVWYLLMNLEATI